MAKVGVISTQVPANESLSGTVDLGSHRLIAFEMPEGWAGTTITFQSKAKATQDIPSGTGEGGLAEDLDDVYDDNGTELSVTVAANRIVGLRGDQASILSAIRYLRIRSGTSASPVTQNPAREIRLLVKE